MRRLFAIAFLSQTLRRANAAGCRGHGCADAAIAGEGAMRWFGIKVYDIRLWTLARKFTHAEPFALELVYDMNLNGKEIAEKAWN